MHRLQPSIRNPVSHQRNVQHGSLQRPTSPGHRAHRVCIRTPHPAWRVRALSEDDQPGKSHLSEVSDGGADRSYEDLFAKEVKLRGLAGSFKDSEGPKVGSGSSSAPQVGAKPPGVVDPFASSSTRTRPPRSPPPQAMAGSAAAREESEREGGGAGIGGQRARSMAMVTEGLEGLIPRVTVLAQLGGGLFLAFLPFMALFSILFSIAFYAFGDSFIHGGMPNSQPLYMDPQDLLSQPTVDPYISFR